MNKRRTELDRWPVKVGMALSYSGTIMSGDAAGDFARAVEAEGCESLWASEHIVVPVDYESRYPYNERGKMAVTAETDIGDPLELATWFAAAAPTLRVGTGVLILPLHNPLTLAKRAATINRLTGDRLLLGVGVGWLEEEYQAVGVDFYGRPARAEDYVKAMQALWAGGDTYHGSHVRFDGVVSLPRPNERGAVHVVMGGHSPYAARRAGKVADGFYPLGNDPENTALLVEEARKAAASCGRDPAILEITSSGSLNPHVAAALIEAGVDRFMFQPRHDTPDEVERVLEAFERRVVAHLG